MALFDFAKDILGVAQAGAGIAGLFKRQKTSPEQKALQASIERSQQLAGALSDPNSPMLRNLSDQKLEAMRTARAGTTREFLGAATRQARRFGSGSSFYGRNPRRDEALTRALAMAGQDERLKADEAARGDIATALSGQNQSGALARSGIEPAWMQQQRKATILPGALGAGADLAGALERMAGGWGGGMAQPVPTTINDPNAGFGAPTSRSVNTSRTGGLIGWI
jgi:hypothetical protein